ncbi:MAG: hypothetical protein IT322_09935 [Anaerolineae bacterium]|nr:hypothetical protein [Anaerolineae bacterium]
MQTSRSAAFQTVFIAVLVLVLSLSFVTLNPRAGTLQGEQTPTPLPDAGADPAYQVGAFYYPWYGNRAVNGTWVHWDERNFSPPKDLSSDYYPALGAYSSTDPEVVAKHCAWLRAAGVGVIISSWWGRGTYEDKAVPVLLEVGAQYGIKVAFHLEPYTGRTADSLVEDITYLYSRYGDHPAFYRTQQTSRWSPDKRNKGLFFVWSIEAPDTQSKPVKASYWQAAMDKIHALPEGALVIANTTLAEWVDGGHFDGLYNYATLHPEREGGFLWAQTLPPDAWYVPSVIPGFSARRIGYPQDTYVARQDGLTYGNQWGAALGTGVKPQMVTITSFNEWHEGTQIEPIAVGVDNGRAYTYADFGTLAPDGYLRLTQEWVTRFLHQSWPTTTRIRFQMVTTSDWSTFGLITGAGWMRPSIVSSSTTALFAGAENGRYLLTQSLRRANAGEAVEMMVDLVVSDLTAADTLTFAIERGHLGSTRVVLYTFQGSDPITVQEFTWGGIAEDERNTRTFSIKAARLLNR